MIQLYWLENVSKSSVTFNSAVCGAVILVPEVFVDNMKKQLSECVNNHFIWILAPLSPMKTDNNLDCWHFVMRSFVATTFTGKCVLTLKEFSCNYEKVGKCSLQYLLASYPKLTFCHDQILQQKLYETVFWRLFRKWKGLFQFFFFFLPICSIRFWNSFCQNVWAYLVSRDCFHQSPPFPIITAQSVDNYLVMLQKGKKENHKSSVKKEFFFK